MAKKQPDPVFITGIAKGKKKRGIIHPVPCRNKTVARKHLKHLKIHGLEDNFSDIKILAKKDFE